MTCGELNGIRDSYQFQRHENECSARHRLTVTVTSFLGRMRLAPKRLPTPAPGQGLEGFVATGRHPQLRRSPLIISHAQLDGGLRNRSSASFPLSSGKNLCLAESPFPWRKLHTTDGTKTSGWSSSREFLANLESNLLPVGERSIFNCRIDNPATSFRTLRVSNST